MGLKSRFIIFCFCILFISCDHSGVNSITSPNGNLILMTSVNTDKTDLTKYLCVKFQITDTSGKVLYVEQTGASDRMGWEMKWDGDTRIVLKSSDIGTYTWEQQPDGSWHAVP